jgi:hypothetical protein
MRTLFTHIHTHAHTHSTQTKHIHTHTHTRGMAFRHQLHRDCTRISLSAKHTTRSKQKHHLSLRRVSLCSLFLCACESCVYMHVHACMRPWVGVRTCLPAYLRAAELIHLCTRTDISTYVRTYVRAYIHACIHTYMHECTDIYTHTCIHICMRTHTHMHACMHAFTHTNTYIHTYTHACIHTYTHTYIHTCRHALSLSQSRILTSLQCM